MSSSFFVSQQANPHPERTRILVAAHPDARRLIGRNPWTMAIAVGVVAFQFAMGALVARLSGDAWWPAILAAWCIGAFASHALYVVIHEATHDLIFERRWMNRVAAIIADLPNIFPAAMGFRVFHLKHHAFQGDHDQDIDLPSHWEASIVGNRPIAKALWLLLFPLAQLLRLRRVSTEILFDRWFLASYVTALGTTAAVYYGSGATALLYLFASFWFSVGLHPLGGRWIQEHYTCDPRQETGSYYGPLNVLALNVGYHNEHHDLPSVPWNRLPRLKAMAPELYRPLQSYRSWSRLVVQFISDPRYSLWSRVVRADNVSR